MDRPQLPGSTDGDGAKFLLGANLPWLTYGGDFGANAWQPSGGVARPGPRARLREILASVADTGVTCLRWFLLCDGRAGIVTGGHDGAAALDDFVLADVDAAIEEADHAHLGLIVVLIDFLWFAPPRIVDGVRLGGRTGLVAGREAGAAFVDRVARPLFERYGHHPGIVAWDLINEPEWATWGEGCRDRAHGVSRADMRAFIGTTARAVHDCTNHPATVGLASLRGLPLVRDLDLDVYQVHWYDRLDRGSPLDRPVEVLGLDRPIILGEFPTRGSARTPEGIIAVARAHGYRGAFAWSVLADDEASDRARLAQAVAWRAAP